MPNEINWLKKFFSGNNHLHWDQIVDENARPDWLMHVTPWLQLFSKSRDNNPIVLPMFGPSGPEVWYGMASTDRVMGQLIEDINSFIGPSYSDFHGVRCELSEDNKIESALMEQFGNRVVRFRSSTSPEDQSKIEQQVKLYQKILDRRPPLTDRTRRPFGKIRGDFDRALLVGNEVGVERYLSELVDTGRVNAEQKKCLEIRVLAGLGRKEELAGNRPLIESVMELSLPPQTIVDVVEALYEIYLSPVESKPDFEEIKETFRKNIGRIYGPLFKERKGIVLPKVLRAFLLFELFQSEPNLSRCDTIISAHSKNDEGFLFAQSWLENISQLPPQDQDIDAREIARQAIADEDYSVALEQSFLVLPDPWAYSAILRCAIELRSQDVTERVLEVVQNANDDIQNGLSERDQSRVQELKVSQGTVSSHDNEVDWVTWARWVDSEDTADAPITLLKKILPKWSLDEYVNDTDLCEELAGLIGDAMIGNTSGKSKEIFREALPHMFEFFVDEPQKPVRGFTSLYTMMTEVITLSGACSSDELKLVIPLTDSLLSIGCERKVYTETLANIRGIIDKNRSPFNLQWSLDMAVCVASYPDQDSDQRLQLFMSVFEMCKEYAHRITLIQIKMLDFLGNDYGCQNLIESFPQLENEIDAGVTEESFEGLIGICTLVEGAAKRAKDILKKLFPNAGIEINSDKVKTASLTHLARNADIFVFAWKAGKHPAYYGVKQEREAKDIILPLGKGSASIVRSVLDYMNMV
jgi:hypothetical protein